MSQSSDNSYEFGGFVLHPKERLLLHLNRPVALSGKDFDVLTFLLEHPNSLVTTKALVDEIWAGSGGAYRGNITHRIATIRRALGCDAREPIFIRTIHAKHGYRFIAPVSKLLGPAITAPTGKDPEDEGFRINSHIFVPTYLGPKVFDRLNIRRKKNRWTEYKEFEIERGRLCILPSGIAVWHLIWGGSFSSLMEIAAWRKDFYEQIFENGVPIRNYINGLLPETRGRTKRSGIDLGQAAYAYSLIELESLTGRTAPKFGRALKILACPKVLEASDKSREEVLRTGQLERSFLERGLNSDDIREFGLTGKDIGFASWEGASWASLSEEVAGQLETNIEFQIALHSLWWFSKLVTDARLNDLKIPAEVEPFLPSIRKQFLRLKNIEPKESMSERTMIEAVLGVNRLEEIVKEAIDSTAT